MKKHILHSAMLFCLCSFLSAAACSESNPTEEPQGETLTAITLLPGTVELTPGQTATLFAAATPVDFSLEGVRWTSSDNAVVTPDDNGVITARGIGKAQIRASLKGVTGICEVTVVKANIPLTAITVSPSVVSLKAGNTTQLSSAFVPANADVEGSIVWTSLDSTVATVDSKGLVTAIGNGSTQIVATLGTIKGKCDIVVYSQTETQSFTFFQLNIWEGLSNITGKEAAGRKAFIDQLVELKPDVASFCEIRSESEAHEILGQAVTALKERTGIQYYYTTRGGSGTRGLLSRHPVLSTDAVATNNWFYRTVISFHGQEMAIYASHAFHAYYACYLPRGYGDGSVNTEMGINNWEKLAGGPITDVNFILKQEETSGRTQIATDLVADATSQHNLGRLAIFGGDLNQPSHLDWTDGTKNLFEHNGCIVPWPISTVCYAGGMRDAFREVYPNPVTHPGVTWPVSNKDGSKITQWAADADERDRIDFVYYYPDEKLTPKKAQMVGPSAMIAKSKIVEDTFVNKAQELISPINNIWPTDHRGLLITFEVQVPKAE